MRQITYFFLLLSIGLWACEATEKEPAEAAAAETTSRLTEELPGTWESVSLKVFVRTYENTDSSFILDVKERDWEEVFGMRPVKMVFQKNDKYYSEHRSIADTLIDMTRGLWKPVADTLQMVAEDGTTYRYRVKVRNGLSEFRAFVDWDGDGDEDDEYIEIKRLVSIAAE